MTFVAVHNKVPACNSILKEKPMFPINEQLSNVAKTNVQAQLSILTTFTAKTFESFEKMVDLNLNVAKASLEDSAATARQLLAAKDPQEFLSMTAAQAQPTAAKAPSPGKHCDQRTSRTYARRRRTNRRDRSPDLGSGGRCVEKCASRLGKRDCNRQVRPGQCQRRLRAVHQNHQAGRGSNGSQLELGGQPIFAGRRKGSRVWHPHPQVNP
jgi:phasin family protein